MQIIGWHTKAARDIKKGMTVLVHGKPRLVTWARRSRHYPKRIEIQWDADPELCEARAADFKPHEFVDVAIWR